MPNAAKQTILVVEDEVLVRMLGADILEDAGYEVLEASTADEAVALLGDDADVQLLFSDIDMPGSMNGMALAALVTRSLAAHPASAHVRPSPNFRCGGTRRWHVRSETLDRNPSGRTDQGSPRRVNARHAAPDCSRLFDH